MSLVSTIKKVVADYLENENMSDVCYGTFTGDGLKIDSKPMKVGLDMVDIPERLKEYNVKFSFSLNEAQCDSQVFIILKDGSRLALQSFTMTDIPCKIVYDELKPGDRVAVVQKKGTQRFVITDKTTK